MTQREQGRQEERAAIVAWLLGRGVAAMKEGPKGIELSVVFTMLSNAIIHREHEPFTRSSDT